MQTKAGVQKVIKLKLMERKKIPTQMAPHKIFCSIIANRTLRGKRGLMRSQVDLSTFSLAKYNANRDACTVYRNAARHYHRFMSRYRQGLDGPSLDYKMEKYSGHRRIPDITLIEVQAAFDESFK
jgi:hypothetical protein